MNDKITKLVKELHSELSKQRTPHVFLIGEGDNQAWLTASGDTTTCFKLIAHAISEFAKSLDVSVGFVIAGITHYFIQEWNKSSKISTEDAVACGVSALINQFTEVSANNDNHTNHNHKTKKHRRRKC